MIETKHLISYCRERLSGEYECKQSARVKINEFEKEYLSEIVTRLEDYSLLRKKLEGLIIRLSKGPTFECFDGNKVDK